MNRVSLERFLTGYGFTPDEAETTVRRDFKNALSILAQIQKFDRQREMSRNVGIRGD